ERGRWRRREPPRGNGMTQARRSAGGLRVGHAGGELALGDRLDLLVQGELDAAALRRRVGERRGPHELPSPGVAIHQEYDGLAPDLAVEPALEAGESLRVHADE